MAHRVLPATADDQQTSEMRKYDTQSLIHLTRQ